MTRKEAINKWIIPAIKNTWNVKRCKEILEALEQEPFINKPCVSEKVCEHDKNVVLDKIRVEINAMFPPSGNWMYGEGHEVEHTVCEVLADVLQIIDKYKAESEPQESEDKYGRYRAGCKNTRGDLQSITDY